ncbi:ATR-interacting protein isoform X3 [Ahaetulla prasina]|uniref:ATR-interacting protein isoform X3 n=1 Tax=Ahaetulla prasina TaxID=499056 RepID=UPI002647F569|nr:ATR-interacting protein isoform X3 [Ahaetulla prasina]
MSVNNFFGNKKRNSSILYDVDQTKITSPLQRSMSHNNIGNHGEGFPPNKRYKSVVSSKCKETEDPFGDNDDFTVDDLKEIDIIASQALTQDVSSETNLLKTEQNAQLSVFPNSINQLKTPDQWNISVTTETKSFETSIEEMKLKGRFKLETLQAQYKEAMKKLKEMQDEILIKNGEIKILRDSMQQMESTVEDQRKSYILLERQNVQCLNEKEKEFSRKLQSLQSELQFRDAEMNELRTKILNCERIKPVAPVSYTSPKKSPSNPMKIERCTLIEKKSYPTEESFGSRVLPIPSCSRTQSHVQVPQQNNDSKTTVLETEPVKQETSFSCPQRPGSLLLNALMKQPLVPGSSLGICNLLSNTEAWFGSAMQSASFSVFQCLFDSQSQILLRCISSETPLFAVLLTVRMLSLLAEHQDLAARFCSCSETCLLLALYMYITSRPDKLASEGLWLQLEQETVRFLTKCMQCCRSSVLLVGTDCQCTSEAVKALIVMLHRQWLLIRKMEGIVFNGHEKQIVQFLRDAVLLLHGLSQKDKLFHEHCLEVLHQYDGVLSGVTAILRKGQHLKACEELALDELYPLEPEVSDQEMDCR